MESIIAWTFASFNPWMGCTKISDGCKFCYAETLTKNRMGLDVWGPRGARKRTSPGNWKKPLQWNRQAKEEGLSLRVFCGSLMDWAEDRVELDPWRVDLWNLIRATPNLDWQLLTKRADRIASLLPEDWGSGYHNVWLGTSIEDMRVADRADHLRKIPAVVKFISYEPALGALDDLDLSGINWVIYGGESGPGYRAEGVPGDPKVWARSMRVKCASGGVAFFHKQSAAFRTEMGIELDGEIVRHYPQPRRIVA